MNQKKRVRGFFCVLLVALTLPILLCSCGQSESETIESIEQLNQEGYAISVDAGSAAANTAEKMFPKAKLVYNNSINDAYLSVQQGKSDAFVYSKLQMQFAIASEALNDLTIMDETLDTADIAVGLSPDNEQLLPEVNAFIREIKSDGTFDDMYDRWVINADDTMPDIPEPENPDRSFKFATSGLVMPMNYIDGNQQVTGFDVEFMKRLALYLNADITIQTMSFDALVASLESNKVDLVVSDLNVTEERKEVIIMSDPYLVSETVALVRKDRLAVDESAITGVDQLNGKKLGICDGAAYAEHVAEMFPDSELHYAPVYADLIAALQGGKISAYIADEPVVKYQLTQIDGLKYFEELLTHDDYAFVLSQENTALMEEVNTALAQLKEEGFLDKLAEKWLEPTGTHEMEPIEDTDAPNGVLRVITSATQEPFAYVSNGEVVGYDIDLIYQVGKILGYDVELVNGNFNAVFPSVSTGKADIACGCLTITPERAETVAFSTPIYRSGIVAVVLDTSQSEDSFFSKVAASFHRTFITEDRWKLIAGGLGVTILLSVISAIVGTILGFFFSFPLRSPNRIVRGIAHGISTVLDGMPLVVILMLLYYIIFNKSSLSPVVIGIFGFSIDFANVVAGLINTGVKGIDQGQLEAAASMGYKKWQIFTKITLPQTVNQMFSQYNGSIVNMIKGTAVIGYISVQDLTKVSDIIRSRTYEAFFPLVFTALIYFIFARIVVAILQRVGKKVDPKHRARTIKGVNIND